MVYLIIAIFFLAIAGIVFLILSQPAPTKRSAATIERIASMDRFITDFDSDIDRATYISGFRALLAMEEYATAHGQYFTDVNSAFKEAITQGTINGTGFAILENSTLSSYQDSVQQLAGTLGIDFRINVTSVTISEPDPWYLLVNLSYQVNVSDQRGLASWNYNITRLTAIPINDLRDPIYSVNTLGKVQNQVKRTNSTTFVNDTNDANDTTALQAFINISGYTQSSSAPSFLMRFTGNFSASPQGIESIVSVPRLNSQGIVINSTYSVVDYLYFGGTYGGNNPLAAACHIQNLLFSPDWFQLDAAHLTLYNITGALTLGACP